MGTGTSELRVVLEGIRQLDARVTACEKELIGLARKMGEFLGPGPVIEVASPLAIVPVVTPRIGGVGKGKKAGRA